MLRFFTSERRIRWTLALLVIGMAAGWLLSGIFASDETVALQSIAEQNESAYRNSISPPLVAVKARRSTAILKSRILNLSGQTEIKQVVQVQAETHGRVIARAVEDGDQTSKGSVLCRLELNDKEARLEAAKDSLALAEIRYSSALKLRDQNYERETALVAAKADRSNAKHNLTLAEKALRDTNVRAPVSGFVERLHANVGDYLSPGSLCATILELDPIYLITYVAEKFVNQIQIGADVEATLATGRVVSGPVTYIGKLASERTRTFRVEASIENPEFQIRGGVTAEIRLPLKDLQSHRVSSSMLAIDDHGTLGVYTLQGSVVQFNAVEIVSDDSMGLWVTGLPASVTLLTVGQDRVSAGDRVEVQLSAR